MKALLLYPRFPQSFWSYNRTIEMVGLKALMPPLGLITVAALLPQHWGFALWIAMSLLKQKPIGTGAIW